MGASHSSDAEPASKKAAAPASATERKEATPLLQPPEHKRVLGVMAMSAIIWFNVSGGPSGSEEIVAALGPLYAIALMLVFVLFYSVPQALITAELSTAFADNGGYSLWVKAAFGDFWAVQESVWSFASGVVDSALYPVLFFHVCQKLIRWAVGYGLGLEQTSCTISLFAGEKFGLLGHHRNPMLCAVQGDWMCAAEWGCKVFILLLFAAPNFVSTKLVGRYLVSLATFVVLPFFVLLAWGSWHMEWKILTSSPAKEPDWPAIVGVLYWSTAGFDSASTIAGEVEQHGQNTYGYSLDTYGCSLNTYGCSLGCIGLQPGLVDRGTAARTKCRLGSSRAQLSCASSGRAWRLLPVARDAQGERSSHCPPSNGLRCSSQPPPKSPIFVAFDRAGGEPRAHSAPCARPLGVLGHIMHGAAAARGRGQRPLLALLGGGDPNPNPNPSH